jgi:hypothetical protein
MTHVLAAVIWTGHARTRVVRLSAARHCGGRRLKICKAARRHGRYDHEESRHDEDLSGTVPHTVILRRQAPMCNRVRLTLS